MMLSQHIFNLNIIRDSAYAVPATKNSAPEVSTLGILAGVNLSHSAMDKSRPGGTA